MKEAFLDCSRWGKCSVNSCPLDSEQDEHESRADDPQTECKAERDERYKIGKDTDLPRKGLTWIEWGNKVGAEKRWRKKSERKKASLRMQKIRQNLQGF